jgi:hypothetical protein
VAGVGGQLRTLQDTSDGQRLRLESLELVRVKLINANHPTPILSLARPLHCSIARVNQSLSC